AAAERDRHVAEVVDDDARLQLDVAAVQRDLDGARVPDQRALVEAEKVRPLRPAGRRHLAGGERAPAGGQRDRARDVERVQDPDPGLGVGHAAKLNRIAAVRNLPAIQSPRPRAERPPATGGPSLRWGTAPGADGYSSIWRGASRACGSVTLPAVRLARRAHAPGR